MPDVNRPDLNLPGQPRFSSLADWLSWQETLHPNVIDLGLARVMSVASILLGEKFNQSKPLTITVAGTNGKGSCVKTLSVLLQAAGKRVGAFTSPHMLRYNERICIDNAEVSDADLCEAFAAIDHARGDTSLTYFEFNALAALWLFRKYRVDVQVLEVGLGGRLDAANIVDADIAVITNIALDHIDWLGDTREKIGVEKAGILRAGGKLVYGEADMPVSIREQLQTLVCSCRQMGKDFDAVVHAQDWHWQGVDDAGNPLQLQGAVPALASPSVACALQVLAWLGLWRPEIFSRKLPDLSLAGRFESVWFEEREFIFDVAHNAAGIRFLVDRLQQKGVQPCTAIFSAMSDKDLSGMVSALAVVVPQWHVVLLTENPRAANKQQLLKTFDGTGVVSDAVSFFDRTSDAIIAASSLSMPGPVLVCGSFFTVSAIKAVIKHESQ